MNNFANALKDMERADQIIEDVKAAAILLGAKERGLTSTNAIKAVNRHVEEYVELLEEAEELGSTLPNILKSYRMRNHGSAVVPVEMKYAPSHWVSEDSVSKENVIRNGKTRTQYTKVKGVTAAQASRLRRGIQGQLEETFSLLEESPLSEVQREELRGQIIETYQTATYREFTTSLLEIMNDWVLGNFYEDDADESDDSEVSEEELLAESLALLA